MRVAKVITLSDEERTTLERWSRGRSTPARLVLRAKIVLAAAQGRENKDIAADLGCTRRTVGEWRIRFAEFRLKDIEKDAPRGGRTPKTRAHFEAEIIRMTIQETPPNATQWSTRSLAKALGCHASLIQRVWKDNGLQPHRTKPFKSSNDRQFVEKLVDVVGLYLDPPDRALILSCDEKSQIQALDRTQKSLPMFLGRLKTLTHDYLRHGTTTLFAAIELAEGISSVGIAAFQQPGDLGGPVDLGSGRSDGDFSPARERLGEHEDARRVGPFVFIVDSLRMLSGRLNRDADFFQQLHRLLIHATLPLYSRGTRRPAQWPAFPRTGGSRKPSG